MKIVDNHFYCALWKKTNIIFLLNNIYINTMGKNYRNCIILFIQIHPHLKLQEGHLKRKELIMNYNLQANMALKTKDKYGEFISYSLNLEKLLVNFSPSNKKIPEDCLKELHFLTECIVMDCFQMKNLNSIMYWV